MKNATENIWDKAYGAVSKNVRSSVSNNVLDSISDNTLDRVWRKVRVNNMIDIQNNVLAEVVARISI